MNLLALKDMLCLGLILSDILVFILSDPDSVNVILIMPSRHSTDHLMRYMGKLVNMVQKKSSCSLSIPNASVVYSMQSRPVACPVNESQDKSLEFTINRTLMKLFRTVSSDDIKECRCFFGGPITDTKLLIVKRKMKFLYENIVTLKMAYVNCSQTLPV